ncbi:hypothetical protein [Macrococcus animalis]|uniref:hypothetical protein n=1 Tax=Macrococcus animalis TaxID=3395467 RepID=UPI0039BE406E
MKKLLAATMIATSLVSPMVINHSAEAATLLEKKTIVLPEINKTNITQMKKGTFTYQGVRLGMTKKQVESHIGKARFGNGMHDKEDIMGTHYGSFYGKGIRLSLNYYDINYKTKFDNAKLSGMSFDLSDNEVSKAQIEKYTGKATSYEGNMKTDKEIKRYYGKLGVHYMKINGKWKAIDYAILSPMNEIGMHEYGYKEGRKLPAGVTLPEWL